MLILLIFFKDKVYFLKYHYLVKYIQWVADHEITVMRGHCAAFTLEITVTPTICGLSSIGSARKTETKNNKSIDASAICCTRNAICLKFIAI